MQYLVSPLSSTYESGSGGATEVTVSGGTGSGMKVKVVVDSGDTDAVNSIVITDLGVGFTGLQIQLQSH